MLEEWLRKNNMTVNDFASMIPCTRRTILKIKQNKAVEPKIANRVIQITRGWVKPEMNAKGRPKGNHGN